MKTSILLIYLLHLGQKTIQTDLQGFDDSVLFDIQFSSPNSRVEDNENSEDLLQITSSMREKFECRLPTLESTEPATLEPYVGPSPLQLLHPLFIQGTCSYRLESYWTYEVCHGKYVRQYHEEREGKSVKLQEYILGKWDENHLDRLLGAKEMNEGQQQLPTKKIDNVNLPYFEVLMENGTACDLNQNKPRTTRLVYVCFAAGKHEVYLLKEISTCTYEIIILTPLLCSHPKYKPKSVGELKIDCRPSDSGGGIGGEPYSFKKLKRDSAKLRKYAELDRIKVELVQFTPSDAIETKAALKIADTSPVKDFLQGKHCLYGGTGWWKFEFCYGKSVDQFHIERDGSRTSINLGNFNKKKHLEWILEHPHKRSKPTDARKQLSHFYSDGSICDKTGQPRQTEVKLKCPENRVEGSSPASVSLFLLEPKYCEYILGVESPLICDILDKADENGLVEIPPDFDEQEIIKV